MKKQSRANLTPKRQRTQYSCMATSMSMCLQALDYPHANEDEVNKVMGALPMRGAAWEQALACAQHYGCRATLTMPSTVKQLKEWTDRGVPVMIAWNPEGREWSHASVVFDVDEDLNVYIADPNIPDPDETVRVVPKSEFYKTWYEKWPNYLVRRPACAIEREITPDGRQVMASRKLTANNLLQEVRKLKKQAGWTDFNYERHGWKLMEICATCDNPHPVEFTIYYTREWEDIGDGERAPYFEFGLVIEKKPFWKEQVDNFPAYPSIGDVVKYIKKEWRNFDLEVTWYDKKQYNFDLAKVKRDIER